MLLRKGVYPYEYMDEWQKFDETPLPEKGEICSNLNTDYITREKRGNCLVSEPNYHTTKFFTENCWL